MKPALSVSVGTFIALAALKIAGVLRYEGVAIRGLGNLFSTEALVLYIGVLLVLLLDRFHVTGAVLISVLAASAICAVRGVHASGDPLNLSHSGFLKDLGGLDLTTIFDRRIWSVVLVLFLIDFYGSVAKLIGLTMRTNIVERGGVPRMREALLVDGAATMAGAVLGTSSLTIYVESAVGIAAGGRTGLTAVVCAALMCACLIAGPLLAYIPLAATTGALVFVAVKLLPSFEDLKTYGKVDLIAIGLMQIVVILTFALDRAMLTGFIIYLIEALRKRERINPYLLGSIVLLITGVVLQL